MNYEIQNLIETLHRTHLDNAMTCYQAMHGRRQTTSISPITNLIFELFLYNSLYSVDWRATCDRDQLTMHDTGKDGPSETKKQRELLKFCRERCQRLPPSVLANAFSPLAGHLSGDRDWMRVQSDERITVELGERFFRDIEQLAHRALDGRLEASKTTFEWIENCTYFTYLVRNNIFHGQKRLGEIYDPSHMRRLSIYDLFVRCVNSMFFLVTEKNEYGSVYAQYPIRICCGNENQEIPTDVVSKLVYSRNTLRSHDSFLYWRLSQLAAFNPQQATPKGLLFYPSSGYDLLLPLIIGLPYCDEFHFYENGSRYDTRRAAATLMSLGVRSSEITETHDENELALEFNLLGGGRRIVLHMQDNLEFLQSGLPIRFYFHRGDSRGEGGSNQEWDGDLLEELLSRSDDRGMLILTEGEPGGLS
ncbi:MAG: hypothetical protein ACK57P_16760, partial [Planctomycetota bacterium]